MVFGRKTYSGVNGLAPNVVFIAIAVEFQGLITVRNRRIPNTIQQ